MNTERLREKRVLNEGSVFFDLTFMERSLIKYSYILRTASGVRPYVAEDSQFFIAQLSVCLN